MKLADLEKQFAPYRNRYGFVSADNNRDHNPLFHGFYVALLDRYGLLDDDQRRLEMRRLNSLVHPDYPGILLSAPHGEPNRNEHSHDNLKAMFWLSQRLGMSFAADFLAHGRKHRWNWNADNPNEWDWKGTYQRFGGMIAQAKIAAGEAPSLGWLWLNGELLLSAHRARGRIERMTLPYFMCKTLRGHHRISDVVIDYWRWKGLQKYPGGIGEVFQSWGGPWRRHPYVEHYWGVLDV